MAKELPYFKFEPNQWENGNIQMLSREDKGLFIDLCCIYWSRLGDLPDKLAIMKLCNGQKNHLDELLNNNIISIENDFIKISFLDEQLQSFKESSKINSFNASSRWEKTPERIKGNLVYVIRCWNEGEEFIKIGITDTSINRRFSGKIPYNYEAIIVDFYENIYLESQYNEVAKGFEYSPNLKFSGNLECYKPSVLPKLIEFANIRNAKYIRKLSQSNAIREEKKRKEENRVEEKIIEYFPDDFLLNEKYIEFLNFRKAIKKPLKDVSIKANIKQLLKLAGNNSDVAIQIMEQSIANGWQGFFELKQITNGNTKSEQQYFGATKIPKDYDPNVY